MQLIEDFVRDSLSPWLRDVLTATETHFPSWRVGLTLFVAAAVVISILYRFRRELVSILKFMDRHLLLRERFYIEISINDEIDNILIRYGNEVIATRISSARIVFLKPKQRFANKEQAENYFNERKTIVIWSDGTLTPKGTLVIYITHPDDVKKVFGSLLRTEFSTLFQRDQYAKLYPETLSFDVTTETGRISDVAIYVASYAAMYFIGPSDAKKFFEELISQLQTPEYRDLARKKLHEIYSMLCLSAGLHKDKIKTLHYGKLASNLYPDHPVSLANLAVAKHLNGDYPERDRLIERAISLHRHDPVTLVNAAYASIIAGKYKRAAKLYKEYSGRSIPSVNTQIIAFLEDAIRENPSEYGFFFARGYFEFLLGELELAAQDFKAFLRRADSKVYGLMYKRASYYLKNLK